MKIFQLILSNKISGDLRYATELRIGMHMKFKDIQFDYKIITEELIKEDIQLINTYDYVFIHNIENNKNQYIQIINDIKIKKILFIANQNIKKLISKINSEYFKELLNSCYKIVLNKNIKQLTDYFYKLSIDNSKLIQLEYIYNADYTVIDIPKHKEIIQISNKGLNSKYELFIKLFENKQEYFKDFIWKIYGCDKNIQTLSIDKLFIDKKTNKQSKITNTNIDYIIKDKLNIYSTISNYSLKNIILNTFFACCFDNFNYINYTILDIIYNGTIPVFNINYAKNIKINSKQSIYDVIKGIYIDEMEVINNDLLINMNKYIKSESTYKSLALRNIKICDQLFNPQKNITNLLNNIKNE